jgi:hypothetical protein
MQPSLHSDRHFVQLVLDQCEVLTGERVADPSDIVEVEWRDEILREAMEWLADHGFGNVLHDDTFLIWEGGIPKEWLTPSKMEDN